jgi:hypothetical protein
MRSSDRFTWNVAGGAAGMIDPDVLVFLTCPACDETWHAATIRPGAWWAKAATPEKIAAQCYCRRCNWPPPMKVAGGETQLRLF